MQNKIVSKLFKEKEILSSGKFYEFIDKLKIIVFVPHKFVDIVADGMFGAGAGRIANYDMCSFRTEGTGTYKPNEKAKPLLGKKNFLSRVEEIKLEIECTPGNLDQVLDAMLKNHPYEETAYEVYEFKKRGKEEFGVIVNLKSKMKLMELFKRMNKNISNDKDDLKNEFKKIAFTDSEINETKIRSAKFLNCEYLISISNKNYKLIKLH
ncbi:MAG: hypothetical protein IPL53_05465 [Ignavibacteria bacterium]|nr:hypothetical protein [Ignavibacteria bacterium]